MERVMGIEPTLLAWEARALPLSYTRVQALLDYTRSSTKSQLLTAICELK